MSGMADAKRLRVCHDIALAAGADRDDTYRLLSSMTVVSDGSRYQVEGRLPEKPHPTRLRTRRAGRLLVPLGSCPPTSALPDCSVAGIWRQATRTPQQAGKCRLKSPHH